MDRTALTTAVSNLGYDGLTTQIQSALSRHYRRILGMRRWDFLEATATDPVVAGDTALTLPADCRRVDAIELKDAQGLTVDFEFRPYQQFRAFAKWQTTRGIPQLWTIRGGVVSIWPAADASYTATIDYIKDPANFLDNATDEPVWPDVYHDVLVYAAAVDLATRQRDEIAFSHFSNLYTTRLTEMAAEHGLQQRQTSTHVQRSKFWDSVRSYG